MDTTTMDTRTSEAELEREILPIVKRVDALAIIKTNEQYIEASEFLKVIGKAKKRIAEYWKPMIEKAHALHKELCQKRKVFDDQVDLAERACKNAITAYDTVQERIRQEAERKAQERARIEEEKRRKVLEERAAKAKEKGDEDKAEKLIEQAEEVHVPLPVIPVAVPTVDGLKKVTRWSAIVINSSLVPDNFKIIDQAALNRYAVATKGQMPVPGVQFKSEVVTERTGR